jgi:hypothetical protein
MQIEPIIMWVGITTLLALIFMVLIVILIIIAKKTHAIIEFKSSVGGTPICIFFQDNRYCEWKNCKPDAGMIEDKQYGSFVIDSTYIDKTTKNVIMPFNSSFAMSLNVKAAKMADDLTYIFKEQNHRKKLKEGIMSGKIQEIDGVDTLRTSVNFSSLKHFVSPILPHSVQSKIVNTIALRLKGMPNSNMQNIILLCIAVLGALILGGLVLKYMVLTKP